MLDFFEISTRSRKRGIIEVLPRFIIKKSSDLMIRGGDFYAVWNEGKKLWSTDEQDVIRMIDDEIRKRYEEELEKHPDYSIVPLYLRYAESGMIDVWHKYCQKQLRDSYHMLDEELIFSNMETKKDNYASKHLNYPLEKGPIESYNRLMSVLYSPEERHKIEWAIGSIISGDSKKLQKFVVLYGAAGTGKSTVLNIIQNLFDGYFSVFDAKALGSSNNSFALESFRSNPLVAIQHDGDLSRIEDNTRLNSLVSHELMTVNEKFKSTYTNQFKSFLFMGTNKPVKITDSKSGLIRRLIDVTPTGEKVTQSEYRTLTKQINFELGGIAYHCKNVYLEDPHLYDNYIPIAMMGASNDFYNFMLDSYYDFKKNDGVSLKTAWTLYDAYCKDAKVGFPLTRRVFAEEMKSYFKEFIDRFTAEDGSRYRSYYRGFRTEKFKDNIVEYDMGPKDDNWIVLKEQESKFDEWAKLYSAQYAKKDESPRSKWDKVKTTLQDLDTKRLHYVNIPEETGLIFIDFDLKDEKGEKSLEKNLEAAKNFPRTYAELSKGGQGLHLIYIYEGNVSKLAFLYAPGIEIKTCVGNSAMRRKLIKCNDIPIATINTGLPLKGDDKQVVNEQILKDEKELRNKIAKALRKEVHANTAPNMSFIFKLIEEAQEAGIEYDISDMKRDIITFALQSTNQRDYCLDLVKKMKFKSGDDDPQFIFEKVTDTSDYDVEQFLKNLIIYDVEVASNLFLVCWKKYDVDQVIKMFNPSPAEIGDLVNKKLGGYNNLNYDNIMLYARMLGYTTEEMFRLSKNIIAENKRNIFGFNARNISAIDIYDMLNSGNKKSLKKHEIELKIPHEEMDIDWDEPIPEERWEELAKYCTNDVMATEAVIKHYMSDLTTRLMLADMAGMTPNTTTNGLTAKIILHGDKNAGKKFRWRDLSKPVHDLTEEEYGFLADVCPEMMEMTHGEAGSLLPYFPGYEFKNGKSTYRGEIASEGGYVYAEPGAYSNVVVLDITSMHPSSAIAEMYFGEYTKGFKDLVNVRVDIKHGNMDKMNYILDGKLKKYAEGISDGSIDPDAVATALKTPINSVYGLTSAKFENPFFNPENKDNIVAKRGALFMIDLKNAVQDKGFTVAHIKTDSIKIPDATPEIIQFVIDFGKRYGYSFEHESTYEKMCLVNDAVYIAKYLDVEKCDQMYNYIPGNNKKHFAKNDHPWTATGTQFQVPYVFKTLFSGETLVFDDFCETKQVKSTLYLDMNEDCPDVKDYEKIMSKAESDYKKGLINDTKFNDICEEIKDKIAEGHKYHFIGRVGQFTPVKSGIGGGLLVRHDNGKYYAVTGTKGYRWMESSMVQHFGMEKYIDTSYYNKLVEKAVETISKYCDIDWFRADDSIDILEVDKNSLMPCGDFRYPTCFDCPQFNNDIFHMDCGRGYDISEIIMNKPVDEE